MHSSDAIKEIVEESGSSLRRFALGQGMSPQALASRLNAQSMRVETLAELAHGAGYKVQLVPSSGAGKVYDLDS